MNTQTLTPTRNKVIHKRDVNFSTDLSPLKVSPLKLGASALFDDLKSKGSKDTPDQPLHFRQIASFLAWVIAAIITDTTFAIVQSLKCTLLLLCELPKPWIDSLRALVPLWLTALSVVPLVATACASKLASEIIDRAQDIVRRLPPLWTSLLASRVFQPLASLCRSAAVPSSAGPSAPSSTMSSPWASSQTEILLEANQTPQKVLWAELKIPDRPSLD